MTNTNHNFGRIVTLATVFLAVLACTVGVRVDAQTPPSMSKKELKTLLATAKTPADQERLAAYYRDKAQLLRAKAHEFSAHADFIPRLPPILESKQGIGCQCAFHYRYFSELYAQEAKDAETLAAKHRELA